MVYLDGLALGLEVPCAGARLHLGRDAHDAKVEVDMAPDRMPHFLVARATVQEELEGDVLLGGARRKTSAADRRCKFRFRGA
jgi:hypothetical protein